MLALRRMSEAFGGIQKLAGRAKLNANLLSDAVAKRKSRAEKLEGGSTRNGEM